MLTKTLFVFLLITLSRSYDLENYLTGPRPEFTESYHQNLINHFDATDLKTYNQRYFTSEKYFDKVNGPIFVYVCGEWTCEIPTTKSFPYQLAKEYHALYYIVEHRYYGLSQPHEDWSNKNLEHLTVQ